MCEKYFNSDDVIGEKKTIDSARNKASTHVKVLYKTKIN